MVHRFAGWGRVLLLVIVITAAHPCRAEFLAPGVKLVPLTDNGKSKVIAWAYHGDWISYVYQVSDSQRQLMIMRSDGTEQTKVSPIGYPFFAEWSWKGDKLSYEFSNASDRESQAQVIVYDVATQKNKTMSMSYPLENMDDDNGPFWSADDQHIAYRVRTGPARTPQLWVVNPDTGKSWLVLPERELSGHRWSPKDPRRLAALIDSAGDGFDAATFDINGKELVTLTDIGAQEVHMDRPRWSPDNQWIVFKNNQDMTKTEQEKHVEDLWIARPDGSDVRNLTRATSPSTEHMLDIFKVQWTWDSRWIISQGTKYDKLGNSVQVMRRIDPQSGEYEIIRTSHPRETSELEFYRAHEISYDGTKLAYIVKRVVVRNWGGEAQYEQGRWVLGIYDLQTGEDQDILLFDEQLDRKEILGDHDRYPIENISWSPDSRSIVLTIANVISDEDNIMEPDVYRLDLPDDLISPLAAKYDGPATGRSSLTPDPAATETITTAASEPASKPRETQSSGQTDDLVTTLIRPQHITVAEAKESLSSKYQQHFTTNVVRNVFLYKGPVSMLEEFKKDLALIDTEPPHILVDLLAVELSDEANRSLGLDWTAAGGSIGVFQPTGKAIRDLTPDSQFNGITTYPGTGQILYQGVGSLPREFFVRLSALISDDKGTILANPRTVATSGKQSLIQIRKTQNFFFNEGFDTAGRPIVKKSDISSDTQGEITPTLLPDGRIHLVVDVGVGTFTFTTAANLPEQTTRKATTEVTVHEGETIVIGGLRQQEMRKSETKVPILGSLPLVGRLFRHEEQEVRHSVLTIFITPQIMNGHNLTPAWPLLDPNEHQIVPIMEHHMDSLLD